LSESKKPLHNQIREKQESKLRLSIKKFIDSYAKGFIIQEEFEPRITTMKQHLKEIEEEKERTLDQKKLQQELSLVTDSLKNFSSSVESKLDLVDWQTKQNIIRMLIHQIEINHNHLYIVFRIKSLANFDQNMHNRIMQCCTSCTDTGIQLLCNLIKNVCFSVRQLPLTHQLSYKQNFWIPDWNDTICCAIYLQK
jgi:site-specific DNA recombinase